MRLVHSDWEGRAQREQDVLEAGLGPKETHCSGLSGACFETSTPD